MVDVTRLKEIRAQLEQDGQLGHEGALIKGLNVIDQDTIRDEEGAVRIADIDAAEVPHLNIRNLSDEGGELLGLLQSQEGQRLIEEEGFDKPVRLQEDQWGPHWLTGTKDQTGYYGRDIGDLVNEQGDSYSKTLLTQGLTTPSRYASQEAIDVYNLGVLDRAQKRREGSQDETFLRREQILEIGKRSLGDQSMFKGYAPTEAHFAANPDAYAGVDMERSDRSITNETYGFQLDDAWDIGVNNGRVGAYSMVGLVGDALNIDAVSNWGNSNADRLKRHIEELPQLRDMVAFDENGEWTLDGIGEFTNYVFSNAAASAPLMAVSIASVAAAPFTYGASLAVPALLYTGLTYSEQTEKDAGRALTSGIFQGALDLLPIKGVGGLVSKMFSKGGRKEVVEEIAKQTGIPEKAAEKLLKDAVEESSKQTVSAQRKLMGKFITTTGKVAGGAAAEGFTETLQEALAIWGEGNKLTEDQLKNRLLNAFVAGGTLGAGFKAVGISGEALNNLQDTQGQAVTDKIQAQTNQEQDIADYGNVLNVNQAIEKIDGAKIEPNDDPTTGSDLDSQADAYNPENERYIDKVTDALPLLWKGQFKEALDPFKGGKYGSILYSISVGGNGRAGRNWEESRRHNSAQLVDTENLDAIEGANRLGYQNNEELSLSVEKHEKDIKFLLRKAINSNKSIADMAKHLKGFDQRLIPFLTDVASKNRDARNSTGIRGANLLEKTFNKSYIYRNQTKFEQMLQDSLGFDKQTATDVTQSILKNEDYNNPDDALSSLLNIAKKAKGTKGQAKVAAQYRPEFNEFLSLIHI